MPHDDRPFRLSCVRDDDHVVEFLHERYDSRLEASTTLDLYALLGEWDSILLTPVPTHLRRHTPSGPRRVVAVGGRLVYRPAAAE